MQRPLLLAPPASLAFLKLNAFGKFKIMLPTFYCLKKIGITYKLVLSFSRLLTFFLKWATPISINFQYLRKGYK